jgi:hypothetical protein
MSPVNGANDAGWSGEQLPIHASLDGDLVDQEGPSQPLGKHALQNRHQRTAETAPSQDTRQAPPPRQE